MVFLTIDTIRGASGLIKQLYTMHANIVTSSQMALFIASSNNCFQIANSAISNIEYAGSMMFNLLLTQSPFLTRTEIVSYAILLPVWDHYCKFQMGSVSTLEIVIAPEENTKPECIVED